MSALYVLEFSTGLADRRQRARDRRLRKLWSDDHVLSVGRPLVCDRSHVSDDRDRSHDQGGVRCDMVSANAVSDAVSSPVTRDASYHDIPKPLLPRTSILSGSSIVPRHREDVGVRAWDGHVPFPDVTSCPRLSKRIYFSICFGGRGTPAPRAMVGSRARPRWRPSTTCRRLVTDSELWCGAAGSTASRSVRTSLAPGWSATSA